MHVCAARVSYALNGIDGENMPNSPRDFINTVTAQQPGRAGNYIVNARKMQGYLVSAWGVKAECSKTDAYYFKSSAANIESLRKEIVDIVIGKCCIKDYVAVVVSLNPEGSRISGHVGMVTKAYNDEHTPYTTDTHVWILPPSKE